MDELEKKFSKLTIGDLEKLAKGKQVNARENQRGLIEILIYLKTSGRWKENRVYAKSSFWAYIEEQFCIRKGSYHEMQRAFIKFPDESLSYGIGLVSKVDRKCGPLEVKKVFSEIDKAKEAKPITRKIIEKIIDKHRDPEREKTIIERKDWKAMYVREVDEHNKTRQALKEAEEEIAKLQEQIERLKATATLVSKMRKVMGGPEIQPTV